ncbi:uncharacterized protein [Chironomus tepperi]|uniref:uncharacterized protein n=1 Tax=Chironomus tepperi TaxID=113505 RepID=UPI00391F3A15
MKERLRCFIALLVMASTVKAQFDGYHSSFGSITPGTTFTLPPSFGWHSDANGNLAFGNSDAFNPYKNFVFPAQTTESNRISVGDSNLFPKTTNDNLFDILEKIRNNAWNHEDIKDQILIFKPRDTQNETETSEESNASDESKTSDELETTTSGTTSTTRRSSTRRTTTTTRRTTTTTKRTTTTRRTTSTTRRTTTSPYKEVFYRYGNTFADMNLLENTYIAKNDYFEDNPPLGPGPLAKVLFSSGYKWGFIKPYDPNNKRWDRNADRKWRATTKAPYFENMVPGEDKILPANAVIDAATAFGLVSLLPLIVPSYKPLMYCGNTDLKPFPIRINHENIYMCNPTDNSFEILESDNFRNEIRYQIMNKKLKCDLNYNEIQGNIFCRNGTLYSKKNMFCPSSVVYRGRIEVMSVLECKEGQMATDFGSFIPTTTPSSYFQYITTTTEKPLSFGAKTHLFILKLMGKFEVAEQETTTPGQVMYPSSDQFAWYPIPLSIYAQTTTTMATTTTKRESEETTTKRSTSTSTTSTTEAPYEWMRLVTYPDNDTRLERLPDELIEIAEKSQPSEIPENWMKILINKRAETTTAGS